MEKAATSGQVRALNSMISSNLTEEIFEKIDGGKLQEAIDNPKRFMKSLINLINNGSEIIVSKVMKFLVFMCVVKIQPVKKFRVGDFFKHRQGPIQMYLGDNFKSWILDKSKDLELSLENETELSKFKLIKNAWDTEIHTDFDKKPIIPVKIFLPLFKSLIENQPNGEAKEDGLDNSGNFNIFNVDLTEINPSLGVVAVYVYWDGVEWYLNASSLDYYCRWNADNYFFALATL